jgi:prevent-host-death family protein
MEDESRYLTLRDANQNFAARVREVEETGREFVVTRRGKPVARIAPIDPQAAARKAAARRRLRKLMREGLDIGYQGPLDRASLYDRGR